MTGIRSSNSTYSSVYPRILRLSFPLALFCVTSRGLHRGSDDRAIFSCLPLPGPLSWNEHRLQGRVQINIKLNYNDSVYRGATHSRTLHLQPLFAMDGTNPAQPLLSSYFMQCTLTLPCRGRVLVRARVR